ncbi:response regulator transcription factor [Nostoc sp. UHCC 0870]|uniref:response regulator transcription factor n=1 Tax=Nostoc sp. UHCC 0870 TaxID=2914041 RepID=UPI001EDE0B38|nr:LuxR C-terminal-related transcriptional regulator [Nostoc sp. UHCC 0870]UKP01519.1 LuxR C-terminal-related transcriptional regulator [Nostoc sp. UHCC 0870]
MLKTTDIELVELAIKRAYLNECLLDPKLTKRLLESHYQNKYNKTGAKGKKFNDPPTDSQIQVLRLLADGLSYEDIASKMFISVSTVKSHISVLYGKWHVKNRAEAIKFESYLQIRYKILIFL